MSFNDQVSSVLFVNTQDVYPPKQGLSCKFTIDSEDLQTVDEKCWIGIYKVGWEMLSDCFSRKFLSLEGNFEQETDISTNVYEVCFSADEIPEKNDEEFYQFCFVTSKGVVLGASCPFQISEKKVSSSLSGSFLDLTGVTTMQEKTSQDNIELEWCPWMEISGEDEDDTVLVHNKTTLLEKSLSKVIQDNQKLRENIESRESEVEYLNNKLLEAQSKVSATKDLLTDKRKQQEVDIEQMDRMAQELAAANLREERLKMQVHEMSKIMTYQTDDLKKSKEDIYAMEEELKQERQTRQDKCEEFENKLQKSKESLKEMERTLMHEKQTLLASEKNYQQDIKGLKASVNSLIAELEESKECIETLQCEKIDLIHKLNTECQALDKEKLDLSDTVIGKENEIAELEKKIQLLSNMHQKELQGLQENLDNSVKKFDAQRILIDQMQDAVKKQIKLEEENCNFQKEIQLLKEQSIKAQEKVDVAEYKLQEMKQENSLLNEKSHGHSGARHALQVAYVHTQRQLAQVREERDSIVNQYHSLRQQSLETGDELEVKEMKSLVEDLKLRLCIGANAYKEKYLECRRMRNELSRLKIAASKSLDKTRQTKCRTEDQYQAQALNMEDENTHKFSYMENGVETEKQMFELQKSLSIKNSKIDQMKKSYEKSLYELTRQIKSLQDQLQIKDNLLQKACCMVDKAKVEEERTVEVMPLREKLPVFEETEQLKKKRDAKSEPCQESATGLSNMAENFHEANMQKELSEWKILYPPKSITDVPDVCLKDPYTNTLRPVVSMTEAEMDGIMSPTTVTSSTRSKEPVTSQASVLSIDTINCPICGIKFPSFYSEVAATNHVNSHFSG